MDLQTALFSVTKDQGLENLSNDGHELIETEGFRQEIGARVEATGDPITRLNPLGTEIARLWVIYVRNCGIGVALLEIDLYLRNRTVVFKRHSI